MEQNVFVNMAAKPTPPHVAPVEYDPLSALARYPNRSI